GSEQVDEHFRHHAGRKRRSAWLACLVTQEAVYPFLAVAPLPAPNGRAADSGSASDFGDRQTLPNSKTPSRATSRRITRRPSPSSGPQRPPPSSKSSIKSRTRTPVRVAPATEALGQIASRRASAEFPDHGLDEKPIATITVAPRRARTPGSKFSIRANW